MCRTASACKDQFWFVGMRPYHLTQHLDRAADMWTVMYACLSSIGQSSFDAALQVLVGTNSGNIAHAPYIHNLRHS